MQDRGRQQASLPKRQVRNPATGEMIWADPKPASVAVRVRPLKKLKEMVAKVSDPLQRLSKFVKGETNRLTLVFYMLEAFARLIFCQISCQISWRMNSSLSDEAILYTPVKS